MVVTKAQTPTPTASTVSIEIAKELDNIIETTRIAKKTLDMAVPASIKKFYDEPFPQDPIPTPDTKLTPQQKIQRLNALANKIKQLKENSDLFSNAKSSNKTAARNRDR